jgi:hypothetical protein
MAKQQDEQSGEQHRDRSNTENMLRAQVIREQRTYQQRATNAP